MLRYRWCVYGLKTLISIGILFVLITFCVNNTEAHLLEFMGYRLHYPIQLWVLMLVFFFAGMIPVIFYGMPRKAAHRKRMRSFKNKIRKMEDDLSSPD